MFKLIQLIAYSIALLCVCGKTEAQDQKLQAPEDVRLALAAFDGNVPEIRRLIAQGVDINKPLEQLGRFGGEISPIHLAAALHRKEAVRTLLELGANFQPTHRARTVFGLMAERGDVEFCREILGRGFQLKNDKGELIYDIREAMRSGSPEVLDLLVEQGIVPEGQMFLGAIESANTELVKRFFAFGFTQKEEGHSPLFLACQSSSPEVVKLLIEHGYNPSTQIKRTDLQIDSPIQCAAFADRVDIAETLLTYSIPEHQKDLAACIANRRRNPVLLNLLRSKGGNEARGSAIAAEIDRGKNPLPKPSEKEILWNHSAKESVHFKENLAVVITGDRATSGAADLLIASLSQNASITILPKQELEQIVTELKLSEADPLDRLSALISRLPATDLIVDFGVEKKPATKLLLRVLEPQRGVILMSEELPWPIKDLERWTGELGVLILQTFQERRAKQAEGPGIAILGFRSLVASKSSEQKERDLTSEVLRRLARVHNVTLLEREQLAITESSLAAPSDKLRNAALLVGGSFQQEKDSLRAQLTLETKGGTTTTEVSGQDLAELATAITLAIDRAAGSSLEENPEVEKKTFYSQALWAESQGLWGQCVSAADSAWLLGLKDVSTALIRARARIRLLESQIAKITAEVRNLDWLSGAHVPEWEELGIDPRDLLVEVGAILMNVNLAYDLALGTVEANSQQRDAAVAYLLNAIQLATQALELQKETTLDEENFELMSSIRKQTRESVRKILVNLTPRDSHKLPEIIRLWSCNLAYWSETPDEFLAQYEEMSKVWKKAQEQPSGPLYVPGHPLAAILASLHMDPLERAQKWHDPRPKSLINRLNWDCFAEEVRRKLLNSSDPAKRHIATWLAISLEPIYTKRNELMRTAFSEFEKLPNAMREEDGLLWTLTQQMFRTRSSSRSLETLAPPMVMSFKGRNLDEPWLPTELLNIIFPIYKQILDRSPDCVDWNGFSIVGSLRLNQLLEVEPILIRNIEQKIPQQRERDVRLASLKKSIDEAMSLEELPTSSMDREAIVLGPPWKADPTQILLPGEVYRSVSIITPFSFVGNEIYFCGNLRFEKPYPTQIILFAHDPKTKQTRHWRLGAALDSPFGGSHLTVNKSAALFFPSWQQKPLGVNLLTGAVWDFPDVLAPPMAAKAYVDQRNRLFFLYHSSGKRERHLWDLALGRFDPKDGSFQVIASNRRRPMVNPLDADDLRIRQFAVDEPSGRIVVEAEKARSGEMGQNVVYLGEESAQGWTFKSIDKDDPAARVLRAGQANWEEDLKIYVADQLWNDGRESSGMTGMAHYLKDRWLDLDWEAQPGQSKDSTEIRRAIAFDLEDPESEAWLSREYQPPRAPSQLRVAAVSKSGVILAHRILGGFWFVPMSTLADYIKAGKHHRK